MLIFLQSLLVWALKFNFEDFEEIVSGVDVMANVLLKALDFEMFLDEFHKYNATLQSIRVLSYNRYV